MLDFNDAGEQRQGGELIPDGAFVRLVMTIRPGGLSVDGADPADANLFKGSKSSDAMGLDAEFTVVKGPYAGRKLFSFLTVSGGNLDDKGQSKGWNMTKPVLKAMIDSATGLDPKDMGAQAKATRQIAGFTQLHGIEFWGKVGVEPGNEKMQDGHGTGQYYPDKNILERVVVFGDPEYADLQAGKDVDPKPKGVAHPATAASAAGNASAPAPAAAKWGAGQSTAAPTPTHQQASAATAAPGGSANTASPSSGPAWLRK